jgi:hypothetical protein
MFLYHKFNIQAPAVSFCVHDDFFRKLFSRAANGAKPHRLLAAEEMFFAS